MPDCVHPNAPKSTVFFPFQGKSDKLQEKKQQSNPDAIYDYLSVALIPREVRAYLSRIVGMK